MYYIDVHIYYPSTVCKYRCAVVSFEFNYHITVSLNSKRKRTVFVYELDRNCVRIPVPKVQVYIAGVTAFTAQNVLMLHMHIYYSISKYMQN